MWAKERRMADEQSSIENQKNSDTIETNKITDAKQQARESAKLQKQLSNKIQRFKKDIEAKEMRFQN